MKQIGKYIAIYLSAAILASCSGILDPMPNGHYTDDNIDNFPSLLAGFVDNAYSIGNCATYISNQHIYLDCATDDGMLTSQTANLRKMANGNLSPSDDPFAQYWKNDYQAIYLVGRFLKDRKGISTQYLLAQENDALFRRDYQGDAYALRAWYEYDLLCKFAGKTADGRALGFVITDCEFDQSTADAASFSRASVDDCVKRILDDCDSALVYLPVANRDWAVSNTNVEGSQRWGRFDGISVKALKALTYLFWASDAFNPGNDRSRWQKAAQYAAEAMKWKLEKDFPHAGKNQLDAFSWMDPNSPECYHVWRNTEKTSAYETHQYPGGFRGTAAYAPTQELVDAFPMANGYPITDSRSGYDPQHPYDRRDPRFYATIFTNGSTVMNQGGSEAVYTFETYSGGKDVNGLVNNSPTNYYLKKFVYLGWNENEQTVQTMPRAVFTIGWRDMCLTFAEAANRYAGPNDSSLGFSAREALSFIRNRTTSDGTAGLGTKGDPYLDECAASAEAFERLVRNERRIEFCFEGKRFQDLVRWDIPLEERNKPVHRVSIAADGTFSYDAVADERHLCSKYLPIPYADMQAASGLEQNAGWNSWTAQQK